MCHNLLLSAATHSHLQHSTVLLPVVLLHSTRDPQPFLPVMGRLYWGRLNWVVFCGSLFMLLYYEKVCFWFSVISPVFLFCFSLHTCPVSACVSSALLPVFPPANQLTYPFHKRGSVPLSGHSPAVWSTFTCPFLPLLPAILLRSTRDTEPFVPVKRRLDCIGEGWIELYSVAVLFMFSFMKRFDFWFCFSSCVPVLLFHTCPVSASSDLPCSLFPPANRLPVCSPA